jgi:hypothetical protein
MPRRKFTDLEIKELISFYKSELKKLQFRIGEIKEVLEKLQGKVRDEDEDASEGLVEKPARKPRTPKAPKAPKAPREPKAAKEPAKKKGRPKKRGRKKKRAPYKLNQYDTFVLEYLDKEDRLLSRNDIENGLRKFHEAEGEEANDEQISTKVTRILQKLGTKRGSIRKFAISGRGYGYGLDKWFFGTTGKLKRKYIP